MKPHERKLVDQVERAFTIIGTKWKPAIMFCLVFQDRMRFGELRTAIPNITQKMLTQRLREMERDGLVTRTFHEEIPPRVEYEVTHLGRSLHPLFQSVCDWSDASLPKIKRANARYDRRPSTGSRGA